MATMPPVPGSEGIEMPQMQTGPQAVPQADPCWDPNDLGAYLVVEGLKRAKVKPLNYSQVTTIQQGPDESPSAFLQCLKDAIQKHTTVNPESQVGEVLLKDKFLTQLAHDICRKLQKVVAEGERSLDQLVQLATSVYYNLDLTKKRDKDKKHQDLMAVLREFPT
jgi:hypothetical protein